MDMNIEISLTSRSKTNYFKKTKKQKKKKTHYIVGIYIWRRKWEEYT